jgi:hypothetical protein
MNRVRRDRASRRAPVAPERSSEGEHVSGIYCQRVMLASGRFTMIDDGLEFSSCRGGQRWSDSSGGRSAA